MMSDKKTTAKSDATPKGAVEVDEQDLEQAAGGSLNFTRTGDGLINYTGLEAPKVTTQDLAAIAPEKKI
jgi:hypothetical protein